jgi:Amt family ammonium transporter
MSIARGSHCTRSHPGRVHKGPINLRGVSEMQRKAFLRSGSLKAVAAMTTICPQPKSAFGVWALRRGAAKVAFVILGAVLCSLIWLSPAGADSPTGAPVTRAAPPDLATRVADLEAYVTNGTPKALVSPGPGHNGWMMVSSALVLFMTLPGLALFYGGLVRRKNVLSVMAQCLGCAGMVTILWWLVGYSFTFSAGSPLLGGLKFAFLAGVGATPNADYGAWVSHSVYAMYQLMFAIITPALIIGAIAERMKYAAIMAFVVGWMFIVYFPLAHMVWGVDGLMNGVWNQNASIKAIDFAGGTVVHMSSGWSALVLCLLLGKRSGFGQRAFYPHSLVLTMIGTGMLWVGWYGFNAGSAVAADGIAAGAFMTTTLATAVASVTWPATEWIARGKPTVLGFCSGVVAGLVVITPAAGFVTATGAVTMGLLAGSVPYFACTKLKAALGYDDALDTFGVHGVGGTLGALVTGFLATPEANPNLNSHLEGLVGKTLWIEQLKAIGLTLVLAVVGTTIIASVVKALIGLRPDAEAEEEGLDQIDHGEAGYHLDESGGLAQGLGDAGVAAAGVHTQRRVPGAASAAER